MRKYVQISREKTFLAFKLNVKYYKLTSLKTKNYFSELSKAALNTTMLRLKFFGLNKIKRNSPVFDFPSPKSTEITR